MVGPTSSKKVIYNRENSSRHRHRGENHVKTEAEFGEMEQVKRGPQSLSPEEERKDSSPEPLKTL